MVTCYLDYTIDSLKIEEFEVYSKMWIHLVKRFGGTHHGYFLPYEGANDKAYALFSFPSLALYEKYRMESASDTECIKAYKYAEETQCIKNYVRSFLKPIFN